MTFPSIRFSVILSPFAIDIIIPSVISAPHTAPMWTWCSKISARIDLFSGESNVAKSIPASANAWSVGAKTVNGPSPCRVVSNSACITAATSESCTPVHWAVRGTSFGVSVGDSTLSITCITPLLVATSASVTLAPFTITPLLSTVKDNFLAFTVSADIHSVTLDEATSPETT